MTKLNQRCKRGCYYKKTTLLWSIFYLVIAIFLITESCYFAYKHPAIFTISICVATVPLVISIRFFILFLQIKTGKLYIENESKDKHYDNPNYIESSESIIK